MPTAKPAASSILQRVLVPTDFSPNAERAAERVARLTLGGRAEVRVLHVVPSFPFKKKGSAVAHAREALRDVKDRLAKKVEAKVVTELIEGDPYVEIVRAARRYGTQLVVLGRHSKKGMEWGLGTTAERVVRKGSTPVLVVRPDPVRPYVHPVVAVDLSDVSCTVVDLARFVLVAAFPLRLVHAYHMPFEGFMSTSVSRKEMQGFREHYRDEAHAAMKKFVAVFGDDGRAWRTTVREGDPRMVVVRALSKFKADLVVLGTHGRSGISHFLLGSVAEWILHEASCDVLIGRPERFTFELP